MEHSNAKHFALQLGALIALYISIGALIQLLFGIITIKFPDELNVYWEGDAASSSIRFAIALLIVSFPTYITLTRLINTARRAGSAYLPFTKWIIYLSLLVGGIVLLGDLVSVINNFLNGGLTHRFLLQALTVLVVVGSAFTYYLYDAKGYWHKEEQKSKTYGMAVAALVIISIVVGYLNIESPAEVREHQTDSQQISDLGTIQSFILNYYAIGRRLPSSLEDLDVNESIPKAPEGRAPYTYELVKADTFKLCAEFVYPGTLDYSHGYYESSMVKNPDDWTHEKGDWCFTRVIDPVNGGIPLPMRPDAI